MGRIFISAGHFIGDPGANTLAGTTEAEEMMLTRDLIVKELESRGVQFFSVSDTLDLTPTINWINARALPGDVALEIHGNSFRNEEANGTEAFYINGNEQRKEDAENLLKALVKKVPKLKNRGAKPDNTSQHSRLAFCRDLAIPSVLLELCFLTNRQDLNLLQNHRQLFAEGIADGLVAWSNQTPAPGSETRVQPYPTINLEIDGRLYEDKGILVNHNSFIPLDLVESLEITVGENVRRISHGNIVFVKVIDLEHSNISIGFDNESKTLMLKTISRHHWNKIDHIMGRGKTSKEHLTAFLKANNPEGLEQFPTLPELYIQEAAIEGVNHDIAFCQMCLETGYLSFGGNVQPEQNNFCGLGAVGGGIRGASFPNIKTGIKAHIEHLKAYASTDPIVQLPIVDPRFHLVHRGVAPVVGNLAGRWATDLEYGNKIIALLKRLYQMSGLL